MRPLTVAASVGAMMAMMRRAAASRPDMRELMQWNSESIPYGVALQIGWNLPMDVVGAGVYGGIVKRDSAGRVIIGDEWPEDNIAPPAHNPVHSTGPYLDFSKLTQANRGYTHIGELIQEARGGDTSELEALFQSAKEADRPKLANLVMTGGARPLHMCGMGRGGDTSRLIETLIKYGADVNAKDNYDMTPMERLSSNAVRGNAVLRQHGGMTGRELRTPAPQWDSDELAYTGVGESR